MVIISFLGKGNYQETDYFLQEDSTKQFKTKFVVQALDVFYNPSKILIFMTDEAEKKFENELKSIIKFEKVKIREGKNEEEIWDIFSVLAESIPSDDELIVDVTHGFRSIPIVALSVIVFLKVLNNIKVSKVVYGAFEARNFYNGKAPVFDITNFLDLIEWSYATFGFLSFGNARVLRNILDTIHNKTFKHGSNTKSIALKSLGKNLDELTTALSVIRPKEVSKIASKLPKHIETVKKDIEKLSAVKPLGKLLDKITPEFKKIAEANGELFNPEGFRAQAQMINFYIRIEKYQQAITLAREAIVSYVCNQEELNPMNQKDREQAEQYLFCLTNLIRNGKTIDETHTQLAEIWNKIVTYRNDINHAGMRKEPIRASKLIKKIKEICAEVEQLLTK